MALPTVQSILDTTRSLLADTDVTGGQVFTNTILLPRLNIAYRELMRCLSGIQNPYVQRDAYYNLPAHTSVLAPSTAGIADMGEPLILEERDVGTTATISGVVSSGGTVTVTTLAPHSYATGSQAAIYGVIGMTGVNELFTISVTGLSTFTLNGAVTTGTYSSGGVATVGNEQFVPIYPLDRIEQVSVTEGEDLEYFSWTGDEFRFPPCSNARQLRIVYQASGSSLAVTDTVGFDDSQDFLAFRTAALAASAHGASEVASACNLEALGPSLQADGTGGQIRQLVLTGIRSMQRIQIRRPPFRQPRNTMPAIY